MKALVATVCLVVALLGLALLVARHERFEWSTDSPRAVAELEAGLEAAGKLYEDEAIQHLEAALEADPDFAAARLYLIFYLSRHGADDPQRIFDLLRELEAHDLDHLNRRERTLVEFFLARAGGDEDAVDALEAYLASHPDDPYVLDFQCIELAFAQGGGEEVEDCLRHLIEVDPNRVAAQNLLAYMAMNQGDFAEAEEQFEIYRFLAPDQANPHDSMGELLMVTGQYGEARRELRRAVTLKPDFCPSFRNLVYLSLLESDFALASSTVDEARNSAACDERALERLDCTTEAWARLAESAWQPAWDAVAACGAARRIAGAAEGTPGVVGDYRVADAVRGDLLMTSLAALAATAGSRPDEAEALLQAVGSDAPGIDGVPSLHIAGLVAAAEGRPREGVENLSLADRRLVWGSSLGLVKLINRLHLAAALAAAGDVDGARQARRGLAEVNPVFAATPPLPTLVPLPPSAPPTAPGAPPQPPPPSPGESS